MNTSSRHFILVWAIMSLQLAVDGQVGFYGSIGLDAQKGIHDSNNTYGWRFGFRSSVGENLKICIGLQSEGDSPFYKYFDTYIDYTNGSYDRYDFIDDGIYSDIGLSLGVEYNVISNFWVGANTGLYTRKLTCDTYWKVQKPNGEEYGSMYKKKFEREIFSKFGASLAYRYPLSDHWTVGVVYEYLANFPSTLKPYLEESRGDLPPQQVLTNILSQSINTSYTNFSVAQFISVEMAYMF